MGLSICAPACRSVFEGGLKMAETTTRLSLPLLVPGQGQKDITHNEALVVLDMLVQPVAQSRVVAAPPHSPEQGICWLIPDEATGVWAGKGGQLACWMEGGWHYATASEGWAIWLIDEEVAVRRLHGQWQRVAPWAAPSAAIPVPAGGAIVDAEARLAIETLLSRLSALGLMEGAEAE